MKNFTAFVAILGAGIAVVAMIILLRKPYYETCDDVHAAGIATLASDEPGYRPVLDRNNNGIACE